MQGALWVVPRGLRNGQSVCRHRKLYGRRERGSLIVASSAIKSDGERLTIDFSYAFFYGHFRFDF